MPKPHKAMPSEKFEIEFAVPGYRWDGADAEGLPIVKNPDGTICELLLRFFGWSLKSKRTKISSMRDEAYILRDWLTYLRSINCSHLNVDDETMSGWRNIQIATANEDGNPIRSVARVQRKLAVVFTFYDKLKEATLGTFDFVSPFGPITSRERPRVSKKSKGGSESGGSGLGYLRTEQVSQRKGGKRLTRRSFRRFCHICGSLQVIRICVIATGS